MLIRTYNVVLVITATCMARCLHGTLFKKQNFKNMDKDNLKHEKQCAIHDVMHSLCWQPTYIETVCEKRMFRINAPINLSDPKALYYAGIMDLLDKKHSFEYYLWHFFETNCA